MFILKAILLWSLVAVHIVGAAFLFRRLCRNESPWLAFLVPMMLVAVVCNFVEHAIPLTKLHLLLPITTAACVAAISLPGRSWRVMRLPTFVFLGAFAITFTLRVFRPNLDDSRDGIADLSLITAFLHGQTLPVDSTWEPPIKLEQYYCFEHYAASVLIRLFGVEVGTGFNLCVALMAACSFFIAGAVAWHLSRGKWWIVALMVVLTACAATGGGGYLWLTVKEMDPENLIDPYSLFDSQVNQSHWLVHNLIPIDVWGRHLLMPPGYGAWMGCFHSAQVGQLIMGFSILALCEAMRRRRSNWPWICLVVSPLLMLTCSTWGVPMALFILIGAIIAGRWYGFGPRNWTFVLAVTAGIVAAFEPMLIYFLEGTHPFDLGWATGLHTQLIEFFMQWWIVFVPWLLLFFVWRRLHVVTRIVMIMAPLAFAGLEIWNIGERYDSTSKYWGIVFIAAWITFLPEVARQKGRAFRGVLVLVAVASLMSLFFWIDYYHTNVHQWDIAHINGLGALRTDRRKARILEIVSGVNDQTILCGRSKWAGSEHALLPLLTNNRAYVAWHHILDTIFYPNGITEGLRRAVETDKIYDGTNPEPLTFLLQKNIAALVIYPDENISPAVVEHLKQVLAPYYSYEDANWRSLEDLKAGLPSQDPPAGVFLYCPQVIRAIGAPQGAPAR